MPRPMNVIKLQDHNKQFEIDIRQDERKKVINKFMKAIDFRFNDTEKGRMIIKTIQEIKNNFFYKKEQKDESYPDIDGLQEFPFRSSPKSKKEKH